MLLTNCKLYFRSAPDAPISLAIGSIESARYEKKKLAGNSIIINDKYNISLHLVSQESVVFLAEMINELVGLDFSTTDSCDEFIQVGDRLNRMEKTSIEATSLRRKGKPEEGYSKLLEYYNDISDSDERVDFEKYMNNYREEAGMSNIWEFMDLDNKEIVYSSSVSHNIVDQLKKGVIQRDTLCKKNRIGEWKPIIEYLAKIDRDVKSLLYPQNRFMYNGLLSGALLGLIVGIIYSVHFSGSTKYVDLLGSFIGLIVLGILSIIIAIIEKKYSMRWLGELQGACMWGYLLCIVALIYYARIAILAAIIIAPLGTAVGRIIYSIKAKDSYSLELKY